MVAYYAHSRVVKLLDKCTVLQTIDAIYDKIVLFMLLNKCSKNFDERPHRRLVTPPGRE